MQTVRSTGCRGKTRWQRSLQGVRVENSFVQVRSELQDDLALATAEVERLAAGQLGAATAAVEVRADCCDACCCVQSLHESGSS